MNISSNKFSALSSYFGCNESSVTPRISADGSYTFFRNGAEHTVDLSLGSLRELHSWKLAHGYYPCHIISYSTDVFDVSLTTFADSASESCAAAYTRMTLKNTTGEKLELPKLPSEAVVLSAPVSYVDAGESVTLDLAVVLDGNISELGSFDAHFAAMSEKWDAKLANLIGITSPAASAADTCRAAYVLAYLTRRNIHTADELAKHVQLFVALGDTAAAHECLSAYLGSHSAASADDIAIPWVVSTYQIRCADQELTCAYMPLMKAVLDAASASFFDEHGNAKDLSDNDQAVCALRTLLALEAYASAMGKIGEADEVIASRKRAGSISSKLSAYIGELRSGGAPLPADLGFDSLIPSGGNYAFASPDAFASIFDTRASDIVTSPEQLVRLAPCLMAKSEDERELIVRTFVKISEDAAIAPVIARGTLTDWCAASKLYIDTFIAMRDSEMLLLGRGIPSEWLAAEGGITIDNYTTPIGEKIGITLKKRGTSVIVDVSGAALTAPIITSLPIMLSHAYSADGCECYPEQTRVISMNNIRHIEIVLA